RGIGVSDNSGEPLYVISIVPERHEVVVGPKSALARKTIIVRELNWIGYEEEHQTSYPVEVKIRSAQHPLPARLSLLTDRKAHVELLAPEYGVSGGQACVFY